jgi:hypothetical protein
MWPAAACAKQKYPSGQDVPALAPEGQNEPAAQTICVALDEPDGQ